MMYITSKIVDISMDNSSKKESMELDTVVATRPVTSTLKPDADNDASSTDDNCQSNFGCYFNDGSKKIDFVLVYEDRKEKETIRQMERRKFFNENLKKDGLDLEVENVADSGRTLIFVKVHVPWDVMCRVAEEMEIKMPLKIKDEQHVQRRSNFETVYKKLVEVLFRKKRSAQTNLDKNREGGEFVLNKPFVAEQLDKFDVQNRETFFGDKLRIEIVWEILQRTHNDPDDSRKRGIEALIEKGVYDTAFPLHDGTLPWDESIPTSKNTTRQHLRREWASWRAIPQLQPLHVIKDYFGEKIGFYFAFMDFYTKMLIFPALFGVASFLYGIIFTAMSPELEHICNKNETPGSYWMCPICEPPNCEPWPMAAEGCVKYKWQFRVDNVATLALACFTTAWSIVFIKLWKRRESSLAVDWDTHDAEEHDKTVRPQYEEKATLESENPVTAEPEKVVPMTKRTMWMTVSVLATFIVLIIDAVSLVVLVMSRIQLYGALIKVGNKHIREFNVEYARWLVHGLILVMILIFEKFYLHIAHKLTTYECPRTNKQYITSLLWKLFIFELLNDFIPIGYAAWMKQTWVSTPYDLNFLSELCDGGCIAEVAELIAVLLMARLVFGNIIEIGLPFAKNAYKRRFSPHTGHDNKKQPQWLNDFRLNEVELDGVYEEYMEMMVQFSFIVLFIPGFPVASLVCFVNNILEIRIDAAKLLVTNRRAVPLRVPGIQIWNRFLDIIVKVGIVCNAALIAFTSDNVPRIYFEYTHGTDNEFTGFTQFSLSKIPTEGWLVLPAHSNVPSITECWYQDMRNSTPPYDVLPEIWQISSARAITFACYVLFFYVFMWFCNTFVDDVPTEVKDRIRRHQFLVAKAHKMDMALHSKPHSAGPSSANAHQQRSSVLTTSSIVLPNRTDTEMNEEIEEETYQNQITEKTSTDNQVEKSERVSLPPILSSRKNSIVAFPYEKYENIMLNEQDSPIGVSPTKS